MPAASSLSKEETELVRLLEHRHDRKLVAPERHLIRELLDCWRKATHCSSPPEAWMKSLGMPPPPGSPTRLRENRPAEVWWDRSSPPESPLRLWQYIAYAAANSGRPLPPLFKPITDVSLVRATIEARQRQDQIQRWTSILVEVPPPGSSSPAANVPARPGPGAAAAPIPAEIRLRVTTPELTWECRETPDTEWRFVDLDRAREWFLVMSDPGTRFSAPALAMLQEVLLSQLRTPQGSVFEPEVLHVEQPRTAHVLRWLMQQPALRHQLVDRAGRPVRESVAPLHWRGRPDPSQPDDVLLELVRDDGTAAPAERLVLEGEPPWALAPETGELFSLPAVLPRLGNSLAQRVPREVFQQPAVVRRLNRLGLRLEGVAVPEVHVVELRPRFVVRNSSEKGYYAMHRVDVEAYGVSPDGSVVQRRRPSGKWESQPASPAENAANASRRRGGRETILDYETAESALTLLDAFNFDPIANPGLWRWLMYEQELPAVFAAWAERVRAAGVELVVSPELAGLARPIDRARYEIQLHPGAGADGEGGGIDWFDIDVKLTAEDSALTPGEIELLLRARGRFVHLSGKGWRRMELATDAETIARLAELGFDAGKLDPQGSRHRFHALQLADERIAGLLPEAHAERVRARAAELARIDPPAVPTGLAAELRPYQRDGFHFLAHLSANGLGGVLADDMGLGKTVQALAWLLHLAALKAAGARSSASKSAVESARTQRTRDAGTSKPFRALVVCPKSVVPNWESETKRFAPTLSVAPLATREVPADANLVVVNYTQLRLAAEALQGVAWDAVILDEGQNIKNPQSQTAKVARELRATHRVVLTGTPIENRALDLWSLFAFAMPGLLGTQAGFRRAYSEKLDPAATRSRLARRVKYFLLRRTKAQVAAELPPRTEEDLFVELEGAQRRLYDAELKRARGMLRGVADDRALISQRFNILQSLLRLRQICCDPRLVGFGANVDDAKGQSTSGESAAGSAKLEALLDTLEPLVAEGHRVLVFSQFVSALALIALELKAREIGFLTLTGQTENRRELVEQFQSAEGPPVFLLSLKAAGAGLNLTAASYVVLFDPWWNPAVEAQAIDRTHRIGQRNAVIAYRLLARGTIEEKIRQLQRAKADLARAIVQEESLATVLNLDDLRFILGEDAGP